MLPDRVSNSGPLTYELGALLIALRSPEREKGRSDFIAADHKTDLDVFGHF